MKSYEKALQAAPRNSVVMDGASVLEFKLGRFENRPEEWLSSVAYARAQNGTSARKNYRWTKDQRF